MDEQTKVGVGLIGFGFLFTFLGVILFFDRGLLALSNIFFLSGVAILLGIKSTLRLFKRNYKGSISFILGFFLLFFRWPVIGILLEIYGSFVLFSGFQASVQGFLYQIPVIGWLLQYPSLLFSRLKRS